MLTFLLYLVLGVFSGVLAGLFGIGGGLIVVPVLVYSFTAQGLDPSVLTHMAVGTSLATIVFTSINSIAGHQKRGAINWYLVRWMTVGLLAGAILGGLTASLLSGADLQLVIGIFAICMAFQLYFGWGTKNAAGLPFVQPTKTWLSISGAVVGWASSIFGIGGGSLTVPLLSWRRLPMQKAVGTSAACGMPIAIFGTLSYIYFGWSEPSRPDHSLGYIYLPALVGIAATSMFSAGLGVKLAHKLSPTVLKKLFALLLLCVGLNFVL